jgi:tetratricopeptide (TPR) repeat protein
MAILTLRVVNHMTFIPAVRRFVMGIGLTSLVFNASAQMPTQVQEIQTRWAQVNYQLERGERREAMSELVERCHVLSPTEVEGLIWCAIVNSSYAGLASPLSAMKYAKAAKADLEKAIELNGDALAGSAYTSLGTLYFKVPSWPLGFGDKEEAEELLKRGLSINEAGIDANYFYADYLFEQGELAEAKKYLGVAAVAKPRQGREVADAGRKAEIEKLMAEIERETANP